MAKLIQLQSADARAHFLKASSYFNGDFPKYISFEPILKDVETPLAGGSYKAFKQSNPHLLPGVNYSFTANKDGRLAWRPFELIHPVLYVSLVNAITASHNWLALQTRVAQFEGGVVICCSAPVVSEDHQTDVATQVKNWWQTVEQRSLALSLEFTHLLHTDVTDCYGALYTHSIPWAVHGLTQAKTGKKEESLVGNLIDAHIRAGRYGQTNGISQGSVLMDFIAEIVLGYVDSLINAELLAANDVRILRYRDDYRIFSNTNRGARIAKVMDALSTYQLRTHYLIYATVRALFSASGLSLNMEGRSKMQIFIPFPSFFVVMDFSDAELGQLSSLLAHIFFGLNGDNLLEGQWQYGDKDSTVKLFAGATDGGIVCQPSALGGELFLWAFGHADKPLDYLFAPEFSPIVEGLPNTIQGACATKA